MLIIKAFFINLFECANYLLTIIFFENICRAICSADVIHPPL